MSSPIIHDGLQHCGNPFLHMKNIAFGHAKFTIFQHNQNIKFAIFANNTIVFLCLPVEHAEVPLSQIYTAIF